VAASAEVLRSPGGLGIQLSRLSPIVIRGGVTIPELHLERSETPSLIRENGHAQE